MKILHTKRDKLYTVLIDSIPEIGKSESAPSGEKLEPNNEAKEASDVIFCIPTEDSIVSEIAHLCRGDRFRLGTYKDILKGLQTNKFVVVWRINSELEPNSDNEGFSSSLKKTVTSTDCQNSKSRQQSKSNNVQFFVPIKTATTNDFSNAIKDLIDDNSFKGILCSGIGNLSDKSPLVVVCPISSRFEPDIDSAIDGIKWKKTFVVLLLHSGLESSLPKIPTASRLAHAEKYKNIVFIDVAYTKDEKLYQCQMNEKAKNQLQCFLQNFTKLI